MENITLGQIVASIGIISAIWTFSKKIFDIINKPHDALNETNEQIRNLHNADMKKVDNRIIALEQDNEVINNKLDKITQDNQFMMSMMLNIMEHMVTGNHQKAMKESIKKTQKYLINR